MKHDKNSKQALFDEIKSRYDRQTSPYYAAARLWVDAIIDPRKTREVISIGIEMADHCIVEKFNSKFANIITVAMRI